MWPRTKSDRTTPVTANDDLLADRRIQESCGRGHSSDSPPLSSKAESDGQQSDELLDGGGGLLESGGLFRGELELDDPLDAPGAEHDWHAHEDAVDPVLALEVRGARQDLLAVVENRLGHLDGGRGRGVIGRARLQEVH